MSCVSPCSWNVLGSLANAHSTIPVDFRVMISPASTYFRLCIWTMPDIYHDIGNLITEVLDSVSHGIKPNISNLARIFDLPRSRLSACYPDRDSRTRRDPANTRSRKDHEIDLCRCIDLFEHVEIFPRREMVLSTAQSILQESDPRLPNEATNGYNGSSRVTRSPICDVPKR